MVSRFGRSHIFAVAGLAILASLSLLVVAGCTSGSTSADTTATSISAQTNDDSIKVSGKDLSITLDENPTTGYSWALTMTGDGLSASGDAYTEGSNPQSADGVGGTHKYDFTGTGTGTATLTFEYTQQWEGGQTGDAVAYNVVISSDGTIVSCMKTAANTGDKTVPAAGVTFDGANLAIVLEENATTGYSWSYALSNDCVEPVSDTYFTQGASASTSASATSASSASSAAASTSASASASVSASTSPTSATSAVSASAASSASAVGVGGVHECDFRGVKAGTCQITFSLARVKNGAATEQRVYTVTVADDGTITDCTLTSHEVADSTGALVAVSGSASASISVASSTSATSATSAGASTSANASTSVAASGSSAQ